MLSSHVRFCEARRFQLIVVFLLLVFRTSLNREGHLPPAARQRGKRPGPAGHWRRAEGMASDFATSLGCHLERAQAPQPRFQVRKVGWQSSPVKRLAEPRQHASRAKAATQR